MPAYTRLVGAPDLSRDGVTTAVGQNILDFFRHAFLESGAFTDVPVRSPGSPGPYDLSALYPVQSAGVASGTVWQAKHADWCYETGLEAADKPLVASGVYVNGVYQATATSAGGPLAHRLDFPHGRVVFGDPLPLTSAVQAAHSYRWVSMFDQTVPWFREVVLDGFLTDQAAASAGGTGVLSVLNDYRAQTPLVVVEAAMRHDLTPRELGSLSHWVHQTVLFHVITEDKALRDRVVNAITCQQDATIFLYDVNARREAGEFALDAFGSPVPGAMSYPDLVAPAPDGYRWKRLYFERMAGQDVSSALPLFRGVVRATLTTDFGPGV